MEFYTNVLNSNILNTSIRNKYAKHTQELINSRWRETDRIRYVWEQQAYPFTNTYNKFEAWVDNVVENSITTVKNVADFIEIWFKDCEHIQNYKGQFYKVNILDQDNVDEDNTEYYICYDKRNPLDDFANFKCVRCNNEITYLDKSSGKITKIPCYVGTDITSTQDSYAKNGTTQSVRMIIYTQANDITLSFKENDRFMFSHNHAFKVEQIDNYVKELGVKAPTYVKMYIAYEPILPEDNIQLNICDYYNYVYGVEVNNSVINTTQNDSGTIYAYATLNGSKADLNVKYKVITGSDLIQLNDNNYTIIGKNGIATIRCYLENNESIYKDITINIVETTTDDLTLELDCQDNITLLCEDSININAKVFNHGIQITDAMITYTINTDAKNDCYSISQIGNKFVITNLKQTYKPLIINFVYNDLHKQVEITLGGYF